MDIRQLLTTREVAERLEVTPRHVARLPLEPAIKLPGKRGAALYDPRDVDAYATERTTLAAA